MKIFEKIEITNDVQKIVFKGYKHETKLAISVLILCMLVMILTLSPIVLTIGIVLQLLIFGKYLYDRRIKLKKDIDKFIY